MHDSASCNLIFRAKKEDIASLVGNMTMEDEEELVAQTQIEYDAGLYGHRYVMTLSQ